MSIPLEFSLFHRRQWVFIMACVASLFFILPLCDVISVGDTEESSKASHFSHLDLPFGALASMYMADQLHAVIFFYSMKVSNYNHYSQQLCAQLRNSDKVTKSSRRLQEDANHSVKSANGFPQSNSALVKFSYVQFVPILQSAIVITQCLGCMALNRVTVEPLTNDHPHQRPSLSYDHISCDGQGFLFVYESLTSDHPSYTTTPM